MKKTIALYPNHPSQLWVLMSLAEKLTGDYNIVWFLREKDIVVPLAEKLGIPFRIISKGSKGLWGNLIEYLKTILLSLSLTQKEKIDLWITKNGASHMAARILGKPSISFTDDDVDIIPLLAYSSFPFTNLIIAPESTRMGKWEKKTRRISGNFEMLYLHPNRFKPDPDIFTELGLSRTDRFAIIRLVSLTAHHDIGAKGVTRDLISKVINLSKDHNIKIFITSEKPLESSLEQYRLQIPPHRVHHALYHATYFLGDSQTMTTEAALVGTPAFRINSFVGKINSMEEMEKRQFAFGFKPDDEKSLLHKLEQTIASRNRKEKTKDQISSFYAASSDPLDCFLGSIIDLL
ncbi:MAG: DUF354 domain-containing protein [Candidatus Electrothrix sp. AR4]|nr:DUF354 domain-containing protein [Candidatus Electrothrix sp. AR4]